MQSHQPWWLLLNTPSKQLHIWKIDDDSTAKLFMCVKCGMMVISLHWCMIHRKSMTSWAAHFTLSAHVKHIVCLFSTSQCSRMLQCWDPLTVFHRDEWLALFMYNWETSDADLELNQNHFSVGMYYIWTIADAVVMQFCFVCTRQGSNLWYYFICFSCNAAWMLLWIKC